jgi:endonuclease G
LVPAADRFGVPDIFGETFLMTNIVPQTRSLNQYPWQKFESYVRAEVRRGWVAYQIAGVYGQIETLKGRVAVPSNCWKVVIFLRPGAEPSAANDRKRVVAVDMPNGDGLEDQTWQRFRTNIRSIETKTGYNFLAALPAELQETIETRTEQSFR